MVNINEIACGFQTYGEMTPKKLQKLCYYAYSWDRALKINAIKETRFEAWIHGPVSPTIYHEYKVHGIAYYIPKLAKNITDIVVDEEVIELIDQVWRIYGHMTGERLEALTHSEEPWIETRKGYEAWESSSERISEELITEYYSKVLDEQAQ